jgi:cephalosporin hydroxylase
MSYTDIPGWFGFQATYDEFADIAQDGDTIVEIGVAFGRSIAYLASKLIAARKRVTLYGVDPWIDDRWEPPATYPINVPRPSWGGEHAQWARARGGPFSAFVESMRKHAPTELEYINVLRTRSLDASRMVGPCKAVLIDGNHDYEHVIHDISLWQPHIVPGGILAGDDYCPKDFPGVVRAVNQAFGAGNYEVRGTTWVKKM